MALSKKEKEAQKIILGEVNKALDLLQAHLQKFCSDTKGTSIPMVYIEQSIKIMKESYAEGAKKA